MPTEGTPGDTPSAGRALERIGSDNEGVRKLSVPMARRRKSRAAFLGYNGLAYGEVMGL